jgi:hypothetical protein
LQIKEFIVEKEWYKSVGRAVMRKRQAKNKYKLIKQELKNDKTWPWTGRVTLSDIREENYRY